MDKTLDRCELNSVCHVSVGPRGSARVGSVLHLPRRGKNNNPSGKELAEI